MKCEVVGCLSLFFLFAMTAPITEGAPRPIAEESGYHQPLYTNNVERYYNGDNALKINQDSTEFDGGTAILTTDGTTDLNSLQPIRIASSGEHVEFDGTTITASSQPLTVGSSFQLGTGEVVDTVLDTSSDDSSALLTAGAINDSVLWARNDATQTIAEVLAEGDTASDGQRLEIDEVRARDSDGLKLYDQIGSPGLYVDSYGRVGVNTTSPESDAALDVDGALVSGSSSLGPGADNHSVALGEGAEADGKWGAIALGHDAYASGRNGATALGWGTSATGDEGATALGDGSVASGNSGATALGYDTVASGSFGATALGTGADATGGIGATAIGAEVEAGGNSSIAIGSRVTTFTDNTLVAGFDGREMLYVDDSSVGVNTTSPEPGVALDVEGALASGTSSIGSGADSTAVALGHGSEANGDDGAIAAGWYASASGSNGATAIGNNVVASGDSGATALGDSTTASGGVGATALGHRTVASGPQGATAIGRDSVASGGFGAVALGDAAEAGGDGSIAIGDGVSTSSRDTLVAGFGSEEMFYIDDSSVGVNTTSPDSGYVFDVNGDATIQGDVMVNGVLRGSEIVKETNIGEDAVGNYELNNAQAFSINALTVNSNTILQSDGRVGVNTTSPESGAALDVDGALVSGTSSLGLGAESAVSLGSSSEASGKGAVAIGDDARATADLAIGLGDGGRAESIGSAALGSGATAESFVATALGGGATASGTGSTAIGSSTASGADSVSIGSEVEASQDGSLVAGFGSEMLFVDDSSVGVGTTSPESGAALDVDGALVSGTSSLGSGADDTSVALGQNTEASGLYGATALGKSTTASNNNGATALGDGTTASGNFGATALGWETEASGGYGATALGANTEASGNLGATALGDGTTASGAGATALGKSTMAGGDSSIAIGDSVSTSTDETLVAGFGEKEVTVDDSGIELKAGTNIKEFSTDESLTDDSDGAVPTEQAVKQYVADNEQYIGNSGGHTAGGNLDMGSNDISGVDTLNANTKNFVQPINESHNAVYTAQESASARAVIEGEDTVRNGLSNIRLPSHFTAVISSETPRLRTQVTPTETDTNGLAVTHVNRTHMVVKELRGGENTVGFDYRVTAVRDGFEDKQVIKSQRPTNTTN